MRRRRNGATGASLCIVLLALLGTVSATATHAAADEGAQMEGKKTDWRDDIRHYARSGLDNVEEYAQVSWRRFVNRMRFEEPRQIMAYAGYANHESVWVEGRVLANKPIRSPEEDDSWWDNLRATYERWETDEIEGAEVELLYGSQRKIVVSDREGYYEARFDLDTEYPRDKLVVARIQSKDGVVVGQHPLLLVEPDAEYVVISDMDDTVIHTGITDTLLAARLTFLNNAKTRKPLKGVAGLYRALEGGRSGKVNNPIFYISNSGWNMYDLLWDFIELNDIPRGPLLLRDLGSKRSYRDTSNHKAETFREVMARFPDHPVVLIGDSGQHDAELYASLAKEFPDRVLGIYIRDVDPDHESAYDAKVDAIISDGEGGVPMLLGESSAQFAEHMQSIGLIPGSAELHVEASVARDEAREEGAEVSTMELQ